MKTVTGSPNLIHFKQVSWLQITACGRLLMQTYSHNGISRTLPANSDRIAQDFHLIPSSPAPPGSFTGNILSEAVGTLEMLI